MGTGTAEYELKWINFLSITVITDYTICVNETMRKRDIGYH